MKSLKVQKLTAENFAPYGTFTDMLDPKGPHLGQDPVEFYRDMCVSDFGAKNVGLSVTKCYPRACQVVKAEYHDHTCEAMMPLNGDVIMHVAPACGHGKVPYGEFELFYVPQGTMVVIRPGVWHHAPFCLGDTPVSCLICLPERTYANDCVQVVLDEAEQIMIER